MIPFSQGQPSSSSPCTQRCCLFKLHLILFPKMLRALSLEGLSHLKPSKSASCLVWPSSAWTLESARLPPLISTACCCAFTGFLSVWLRLYDRTHVLFFFLFPPPPPAFPSCGCCSPRYGHHTGQEQRGQYPLCTHTCVCEARQWNLSGHAL